MKVAIIIPAHNEEKRIGPTLESYLSYFENLRKNLDIKYKIIVSINATTDDTLKIVKEFMKKNKNLSYLDLKKGGKGYAVLEGFKHALKETDNELIGFVDADCSTPPQAFDYLIRNIDDAGGIIASRYIKGSRVHPHPTFSRILVSRIYNAFIRMLFLMPYKDTQCGAKLFKRAALAEALPELNMTKWAFDLDLIYSLRRKGYKVREAQTIWSDREYSKINFMKSGPMMALAVFRLRLLNSPFKEFIRIYDKLIYRVLMKR